MGVQIVPPGRFKPHHRTSSARVPLALLATPTRVSLGKILASLVLLVAQALEAELFLLLARQQPTLFVALQRLHPLRLQLAQLALYLPHQAQEHQPFLTLAQQLLHLAKRRLPLRQLLLQLQPQH